ncbi:MAG: nucleoside 2-deoxyribosyltransferase [Pegethrix bostrychoides GSE-TBD4-15B]|jgi:nucleoside 2-deoxyribosyltransferase|uniref:Nucleoside 2-deoxyribosyltransferase n=1 Tax=Pegethrix bostrychoides GSE-TBD4-15B TaxID=2839662 RepID=A0A951U4Z6_9CYAN|nr:nucleoside 2-deoxyribosyltransferase [Pegethrix bostrychoides GSE-TBD4-15B]
MQLYLAGPDVFLPDPLEVARLKQHICQQHGFVGLFPFDVSLDLANLSPFEQGIAIYRSNLELMNQSQLIVANMTPFRGPSMDVGTAFEMGYMAAQGKPVFGYSNDGRLYAERVAGEAGLDANGLSIEAFEMADNLMLEGAIFVSQGSLIRQTETDYYRALSTFEAAVKLAAERLL